MFKPIDYILQTTGLSRPKHAIRVNPTAPPSRIEPEKTQITVFEYSKDEFAFHRLERVEDAFPYLHTASNTWINLDGLRKDDVEKLCGHFGIHPLIAEDILSIGQRPKTDDINDLVFCLLNMLSFNESRVCVESEQVSIILGKNFVITFQEDPHKDPFDPLREKLKIAGSKVRINNADFLFYSLLDYIVDHYFVVMDKTGDRIEMLEEEIVKKTTTRSLIKINSLRKELIILKRNIAPVRELINSLMRNESELIEEKTEKYMKDVYDHIVQANDISENYRDLMINLHDLYLSNVNLKMNEVMKVMAVVTCLLAPATVIGGIFGMNFDKIPFAHQEWGFWLTVAGMLFIPIVMLVIFRKRGWF
ncbi:MAG: magnesium/cobalt transporter CorA [Ferruginibacter sp.]